MPLGEIRGYMETRSPEHFLALVDQKEEAEIDQEIERLKNMKRFMEWERSDHQRRRWRPRWISRCWRKEDRNICFLPR